MATISLYEQVTVLTNCQLIVPFFDVYALRHGKQNLYFSQIIVYENLQFFIFFFVDKTKNCRLHFFAQKFDHEFPAKKSFSAVAKRLCYGTFASKILLFQFTRKRINRTEKSNGKKKYYKVAEK